MTSNVPNPEWIRTGATLREFREMRGLKPDELANALHISRSYLANIEAGRKKLQPDLAARAASVLVVRQISLLRPDQFEAVA